MSYQFLPDLSGDDYAALKADIAARGVMVPVEYDSAGNVLDGHHRVKICGELGIGEWPRIVREFGSEADKRTHARQLNLSRRHLNQEQRRGLIADDLKERPERSNRQIADDLGVSHHTVGSIRDDLETTGQIAQLDRTMGADGKARTTAPARKPAVSSFTMPELPVPLPHVEEPKHVRGTFGTGENEWYTPPEYIEAARDVLGGIDLDPASSEAAQAIVRATAFFTKENDGLKQEWAGRVWLNPPYAQPAIADFVSKMVREVMYEGVSAAIMLTHNYTDTSWFHEAAAMADAICFTRGRIRFQGADGSVAAPTQGQAFFYFGDQVDAFAERFAGVGFIVRPYSGEVV